MKSTTTKEVLEWFNNNFFETGENCKNLFEFSKQRSLTDNYRTHRGVPTRQCNCGGNSYAIVRFLYKKEIETNSVQWIQFIMRSTELYRKKPIIIDIEILQLFICLKILLNSLFKKYDKNRTTVFIFSKLLSL